MSKYSSLVEVEPARPASGNVPAASPVWRPAYAPKGPADIGASTLRALFESSVEKHGDLPALGWREPGSTDYTWMTYKEAAEKAARVHAAFESLGLGPSDRIGVIGANSPEWQISLQALNRMCGICVPLYDTLGDAAVAYVAQHAEVKMIMAQSSKLPLLASMVSKTGGKGVEGGVAYWGPPDDAAIKSLREAGVQVHSWSQLLDMGVAKPVEGRESTLDSLCTIMYTSGTTGNPKGVELTVRAVLSTISGLKTFLEEAMHEFIGEGDVYFSFLTMAHIFGRVAEEFMLHVGAAVGYWQGDARKLLDDVHTLRPTMFCGVPRVFERVYNGVMDKVKAGGWIKQAVYNYAYQRKLYWMKAGYRSESASPLSDALVFNTIKEKLGGRLRLMVTGGAPIPAHVEEFLKVVMGAPVVQGYGLTETCAASFISNPFDWDQNFTVGPPLSHTDLRLEAVPEMGYDPTAEPPRGEVLIKGPGVFSGYHKEEAMTKEVLDSDGFFHTGDIGEMTPGGALRLIDRKKNLFKLSHGEYIAVERVENVYKQCEIVEQLWVYGNSFESCLVAVMVPREPQLRAACQQAAVPGADARPLQELCADKDVKKAVLSQFKATAKAGKLKGFEEIKDILLEPEQFSVENDLVTPSFKLKRPQLLKRYKPDIDAMYAAMRAAGLNK